MNDLVKSYLSKRSQYIFIELLTSETENIQSRVLFLVSILGPVLFIIYMSDTDTCCNHLHTILYADDTVLIEKRDNDKLNADLQDVKIWLIENKLSLNTDKTKLINITKLPKTKNINVKTSGDYIKNDSKYKYLGVHVIAN